MIKVADDGSVTLYTGIPDMGQGSHTAMAIIAAEVLGMAAGRHPIVAGDTDITPFDWVRFPSAAPSTTGNAVKAAAEDARDQLAETAAGARRRRPASLCFAIRQVYPRDGDAERARPLAFARLVGTTCRQRGRPLGDGPGLLTTRPRQNGSHGLFLWRAGGRGQWTRVRRRHGATA